MTDATRLTAVRWLAAALLAAAFVAARGAFATPPTFPPIPLVGKFTIPAWVGAAVVASGFALSLVRRRTGCVTAACGLGLLFLRDQHWLQPWAWQAFLLLLIDAAFNATEAARWQRRLAVSVYVFSALSKVDAAFVEHLGRLLLTQGLAPAVGLDPRFWDELLTDALVWSLPIGELAAGVLLVVRPRIGLAVATLMHAGLLLALGPLGLDHHPGVLIWNAFFASHVWVLFERCDSARASRRSATPRAAVAWGVLILPVLEPSGLWDHWPSWSVYSNRPAVVRLEVSGLPAVRDVDYVGRPNPLSDVQVVSLSGWSFQTWRTPCYPQERFQLAAAAALLDKLPTDTRFAVRVRRFSPRRTGEAADEVIDTTAALRSTLDDFTLNTKASLWRLPNSLSAWRPPAETPPKNPRGRPAAGVSSGG